MGRRRKGEVPAYRLHRGSGQATVTLPGQKPTYLGVYGTPASRQRYRSLIAGLEVGPAKPPGTGCTIGELVAAHQAFALSYYRRPDGTHTTEPREFGRAAAPLLARWQNLEADDFRPGHLKQIRQDYLDAGLSLGVVNQRIGRLRRLFRWGVAEDSVSPSVILALEQVTDLPHGRGLARETEPVLPVEWATVKATLPYLASRQLRAMVLFQWWTGCRPGEACAVRGCDLWCAGHVQLGQRLIKLPPGVWAYVVRAKMAHARQQAEQVYALGPKAQAVLRTWLRADPEQTLWQPLEARRERSARRRAARKTRVQPSQVYRALENPKRRPGVVYLESSYNHGVQQACARAGIEPWSPNQLRHAFASRVDHSYGLDAARATLGHLSVDTSLIYTVRDIQTAAEVARKLG